MSVAGKHAHLDHFEIYVKNKRLARDESAAVGRKSGEGYVIAWWRVMKPGAARPP